MIRHIRGIFIVMISVLFLLPTPLLAGSPSSENDIPIYPGAVHDQGAEAYIQQVYGDPPQWAKGYSVSASPEEVFLWYQKKLGAKESANLDFNWKSLAPGDTTPVQYLYTPHYHPEEDLFADLSGEDGYWPGSKVKRFFKANRKPLSTAEWISDASLMWGKLGAKKEKMMYIISIYDQCTAENEQGTNRTSDRWPQLKTWIYMSRGLESE